MSSTKGRLVPEEETTRILRELLAGVRDAVREQKLDVEMTRVDWKLNDKDELVVAAILQPRYTGEWLHLVSEDEAKRRYRRKKTKPPGHGYW